MGAPFTILRCGEELTAFLVYPDALLSPIGQCVGAMSLLTKNDTFPGFTCAAEPASNAIFLRIAIPVGCQFDNPAVVF
jgi:hypothetical protein